MNKQVALKYCFQLSHAISDYCSFNLWSTTISLLLLYPIPLNSVFESLVEAITTVRICAISLVVAILVCLLGPDPNADQTVYPLEPPDRSSPRATLQTFLDIMNKAVSHTKPIMVERLRN